MKIEGPQFFRYDQQHIQVIRQQPPQSVKPNIFREVDDSVALALLLTDAVELSPQAKEILKQLRKKMTEGGADFSKAIKEDKEFQELFYTFKQLRDVVYGKEELKGKKEEPKIEIQLSRQQKDDEARRAAKNSKVRELLDKMIVYSPSGKARESLKKELEVLGEKIVETCKQFGVRIIVLERGQVITNLKIAGMAVVGRGEKTFDGRDWDIVRGIYEQGRRLMVIGEEKIGLPYRCTSRHEFAHAFDHTFSERNQRRLPLSVQLWNLFKESRKGVISQYALTNPAEYFAESVEAFFNQNLSSKLKENDPQMYQYLENLFEA